MTVRCCSRAATAGAASLRVKSFRRSAEEAAMLLAIDSGNTNAVFAVYEEDTLRASWRISTNARRTADEYAIWLTQLLSLEGFKPTDIDAAIIGNVVPDAMFHLVQLCQRYLKCEPLVVGRENCQVGIGIDVDM